MNWVRAPFLAVTSTRRSPESRPLAADEIDPALPEPFGLGRIVPVGGEGVASRQDDCDVERSHGGSSRTGDRPCVRQGLRRPEERLARNARPIRAFASDALGFDDDRAESAFDSPIRHVLPRRPAADDDDVVLVLSHGRPQRGE
jgi:hypothetical protein